MSGGIDSSVAAALLERDGFDVIGVFMKFWKPGKSAKNRCCTPESEKKARQVARIIGIPFYVFNFEKEFKKRVVDYFLKESKALRTPNPCVVCNKEIKFGLLLEKALKLDADFIATGHYVRLKDNRLFKAKDKEKDQTYFLWQLSQKQLTRVLFPVGDYHRSGEAIHLLIIGFIFVWLSACYWISNRFSNTSIIDTLVFWSKNVTAVYFIQWVIFGWSILIFDANKQNAYVAAFIGLIVLITTHLLVKRNIVRKAFSWI